MVGLETPFDRLWPTLHLVHVALIQLATDYGLGLSTECQPENGGWAKDHAAFRRSTDLAATASDHTGPQEVIGL